MILEVLEFKTLFTTDTPPRELSENIVKNVPNSKTY